LPFSPKAAKLGGMTEEIEKWLLERIERERQVTLELVVGEVQRLLREHIKRDGEALGQHLEEHFAKLRNFINEMQALTARLARLEAVRDEPVDSAKMN
jgi:hypothetical protein